MALLLAADLGGTKSNLWLFERRGGQRVTRAEATLASADYADACAVIAAFLAAEPVQAAAVAIAGPVLAGRAETPNLPWVVEQQAIAHLLGLDAGKVELLNDLAATAHGLAELGPDGLATLNEGRPGQGPLAVIAAGTGLGEAGLLRLGGREIALPTEGGHADFAPGNEVEVALLQHLAARHGHVSWERVVSGPGLRAIHGFLVSTGRAAPSAALAARMRDGDASAAIAQAGQDGSDASAALALEIFGRLYGAEAGNLALKLLATGGVYVAGGIAPKILGSLRAGPFMAGFLGKGRHARLMQDMPVRVVLEPRTALLGAARRAEAYGAGLASPPNG